MERPPTVYIFTLKGFPFTNIFDGYQRVWVEEAAERIIREEGFRVSEEAEEGVVRSGVCPLIELNSE
jgi:hypothetical protein